VVFVSAEPVLYCSQTSPVVCNLPGLPASGNSIVQVKGSATLDGLITNTVTVSSATYDPNLANNMSEYVSVVATGADLSVSQVDNPDPLYAGDTLTYAITVHNAGFSIAANAHLTDTLPGDVTLVSAIPEQGSCNGSSVVICALGNILNGEDVHVTVTVLTTIDGTINNLVEVASDTEDQNPTNNQDVAVTTVLPVADLWASQIDEPDPVRVGYLLTYTLTAHNAGPSVSASVSLIDNLPAGVVLISEDASCSHTSPVVCNLPGLPALGDSSVQVVVLTTQEGLITNTVTVASSTYDRDLANNTSVETTVVATIADLSVTQADKPDPVRAEQTLTYTLTVHNAGPSIAANVRLDDTLPEHVTFVSATSDQGDCSLGEVVSCDLGYLVSGASAEVVVIVIPQEAGIITNTVEVETDTFEDNLANNTSVENTQVLPLSADLKLTLADSPHLVIAGEQLTYTAQLTNLGPSRAPDTKVIFTLSSEETFVASTPSCSTVGRTVTCPLGEVSAGGSRTVILIVQVSSSTFDATITSYADATSEVADPDSSNNHPSIMTNVDRSADLRIQLFDTPDPVSPGTYLTYTLVYTNDGPSDAVRLLLTDTLPVEVDFNHALPDICSPVPGTHTISCEPVYDLAAGQAAQLIVVVNVKLGASLPIKSKVEIKSQTPDPNLDNNNAEATTGIDNEVPTVEWISPVKTDLSLVIVQSPGLEITLTVKAMDTFGIDRVRFTRWDHVRNEYVELGVDYVGESGIYEFVWVFDSIYELPDGLNQIYAYAYDTAGNVRRERIVIVPFYLNLRLPMIMK
jgi:uncharacterized repeat protein (TIGR01451 family)